MKLRNERTICRVLLLARRELPNPPIDDLLEKVESKYALVVYAAKRARQINTYNLEIADGMFSTPGP